MKTRILALLVASSGALTMLPPACTRPAPNTPDASDGGTSGILDAAANTADGACYLIEGIDTTGIARTVCAVISEVIAIIGFIEMLRTASDAGPPAQAQCKNLPQTTYCTTSAERAKGILFISTMRAARQKLDAGR